MPSSSPPPFSFIVGVGRSGTTLLRSICDAHSQLAVAHESVFVAWTARHHSRYQRRGTFDTSRFLSDILDTPKPSSRVRTWPIDPDLIRSTLYEEQPEHLADAIRSVFRLYAKVHGKSRYGDKTPGYDQHLDVIADLLPEARFVNLVRDGRDVALAASDVHFGATNLVQAAELWARHVREAEQAGDKLGPSRYLRLRYEALTTAPEQEVAKLCQFLDLPFEPAMLHYFERPDEVFKGLGRQVHHTNLRRPITPVA